MAERLKSQVRELLEAPVRTFEEIVDVLKTKGIAGGRGLVAGTGEKDRRMRLLIECEGRPDDGVSASVVLSFDEGGGLVRVRQHSSLAVYVDSVSSILDIGGTGLFLVSFSLEDQIVARFIALSRQELARRCRLEDPESIISHFMHIGVIPSVSREEEKIAIGLDTPGDRAEMVYRKDGDTFHLVLARMAEWSVPVHAVDIGRSTRRPDGITLCLVDGDGRTVMHLEAIGKA